MNTFAGVVLEGVTGAGKSSVLAELRRCWSGSHTFVEEERTLGEFMSEELHDDRVPPVRKIWRLEAVLAEMREDPSTPFVLERFHPSYFALLPDWSLYEAMDADLAAAHYRLVVLRLPEDTLSTRALHRVDRAGTTWTEEMIGYFGSEKAALAAIRESQQRRLEALERTAMKTLVIDTTAKQWTAYAERVAQLCRPEQEGTST